MTQNNEKFPTLAIKALQAPYSQYISKLNRRVVWDEMAPETKLIKSYLTAIILDLNMSHVHV